MSRSHPPRWLTPADLIRRGADASDIACATCQVAPWDGKEAYSARPCCTACREMKSRMLRAGVAIVVRDLTLPSTDGARRAS